MLILDNPCSTGRPQGKTQLLVSLPRKGDLEEERGFQPSLNSRAEAGDSLSSSLKVLAMEVPTPIQGDPLVGLASLPCAEHQMSRFCRPQGRARRAGRTQAHLPTGQGIERTRPPWGLHPMDKRALPGIGRCARDTTKMKHRSASPVWGGEGELHTLGGMVKPSSGPRTGVDRVHRSSCHSLPPSTFTA